MAKIAFYAPLKPPDHPVPSGDREMGRLLMAALRRAGHAVEIASRLRSYDGGDAARQARIAALGGRTAQRLLRRYARSGAPDLWFTYHLYHKAPDWIGPVVAGELGIPYVLAEASFAPKQADGKWRLGHAAAADAIGRAARLFQLNPDDAACLLPLVAAPARLVSLPPFIDLAAFRDDIPAASPAARQAAAAAFGLDAGVPWLSTAAMMRRDQKLDSYRCLAAALDRVTDLPWRLVVAGGGVAEAEVRAAFAPLGARVAWLGEVDRVTLRRLYAVADLYVWPAVKEAWGVALLEAQAAGLPAIAGWNPGVAGIVEDGTTGLLTPQGDADAFARAVRDLLLDGAVRAQMGAAAAARVASRHDIGAAASLLDRHVRDLLRGAP